MSLKWQNITMCFHFKNIMQIDMVKGVNTGKMKIEQIISQLCIS